MLKLTTTVWGFVAKATQGKFAQAQTSPYFPVVVKEIKMIELEEMVMRTIKVALVIIGTIALLAISFTVSLHG